MPRIHSALPIVLFLGFLFAPGTAWLLGVETAGAKLQNRTLHEVPALTFDAVWQRRFAGELGDYVWDHLPLRDVMLTLDHAIDLYAFRDSPLPKDVAMGEDGFLFFTERTHGWRAGGGKPEATLDAIAAIERAFREAKVRLVLAVSPSKAALYPEKLPDRYRGLFMTEVVPTLEAYERYADESAAMLNLWGVFRRERQRLEGDRTISDPRLRYLFRPHDRHWNLESGQLQAREIVNAISPGAWQARFAPRISAEYTPRASEMKSIYLKVGPEEPYASLSFSPDVDVTLQKKRFARGALGYLYRSKATGGFTPAPEKVAVIRDSFLNRANLGVPEPARDGGFQALATFFRESVFVHWDGFHQHPSEAAKLMRGADVVVVQVVQGNIGSLRRHRQKLIALARALAKP